MVYCVFGILMLVIAEISQEFGILSGFLPQRRPVAVRYAWDINPVCNLYNAAGLPAVPFRTDTWPGVTVNSPMLSSGIVAATISTSARSASST